MKYLLSLVLVILFVIPGWSASNDTLIEFSTVGPDCYQDGTTVRDGEYYALVWVRNGVSFAGICANGEPVDPDDSMVLIYKSAAKDGRCQPSLFEIDASLSGRFAGGTFSVCLIDTRDVAGKVGALRPNGRPRRVNAYCQIADGQAKVSTASPGAITSMTAVRTQTAALAAVIPADAPQPVITGLSVDDGEIRLKVDNAVEWLNYRVVSGSDLDSLSRSSDRHSGTELLRDGGIPAGQKSDGSCAFFKVVCD